MRVTKLKLMAVVVIIAAILVSGYTIWQNNIMSTAISLDNECKDGMLFIDLQVDRGIESPTSDNLKHLIPLVKDARTICNRGLEYFREHQATLDNINRTNKYWATDKILKYEKDQVLFDKMIDVAKMGIDRKS